MSASPMSAAMFANAVMEGNHQMSKQIVFHALEQTEGDAKKAKELLHLALSQISSIVEVERKGARTR